MIGLIKRLWGVPGMVGLVLLLTVIYLGHSIMESTKHKQEVMEARKPKMDQSQAVPLIPVDAGTAQPAVLVSKGNGVAYHPQMATPSPTPDTSIIPDATPEEAPVGQTPLIVFDFPTPAPTPVPTPTPAPKAKIVQRWLPTSIYIPCVLQGGLDSSHMDTPVQGIVTQNVYQWNYGKAELIIPAGSRVSSFAANGYVRTRVQIKGRWRLLYIHAGTELEFEGIACNQEFDPVRNQYGLYDKTAGIEGELIESDAYIRFKAAVGLLLKTGVTTVENAATTAFQPRSNNGNSISFPVNSATPITDELIQQLLNGHHTEINDTLFVRIKAGKPFWIFTTSIIDPAMASVGARIQAGERDRKEKEELQQGTAAGISNQTRQIEKLLESANRQQGENSQPNENAQPDSTPTFTQ